MTEAWMDTPAHRADGAHEHDDWQAHRESDAYFWQQEPDVILDEHNEPVDLYDGLWLKLYYGIIDEDTYWRRRVREGNDDNQST